MEFKKNAFLKTPDAARVFLLNGEVPPLGHVLKQPELAQTLGRIIVHPTDPNVVYVGSGEANIRGNVAAGMRRQQQRLTDAEHRLAGAARPGRRRCPAPSRARGRLP